jgi:hypothetical protein
MIILTTVLCLCSDKPDAVLRLATAHRGPRYVICYLTGPTTADCLCTADLAPNCVNLDLDDDTEAHGGSSAAPGPWNKVTRSYVYGSDEEEGGDYYNVGKHSAGDAARGEVEMVRVV